MKTPEFKKIIKEAVREAIQEELKDILLEAIKSPKQIVTESISTGGPISSGGTSAQVHSLNSRNAILSTLEDMKNGNFHKTTQALEYNPPPVNTLSEGSALPEGNLSLDQIQNLMTAKK